MLNCSIIIPIYTSQLSTPEKASLVQLNKVFNGKYDIAIVCPNNVDITNIKELLGGYNNIQKIVFDDDYFVNRMTYGKMVSAPLFYERFIDYEYILIHQLDCWVFRDELEYWCEQGYDYIGAPFFIKWFVDRNRQVGNGGFSLRNVKSCLNYLKVNNDPNLPHYGTDDGFFAANYGDLLKIPNVDTACLFSLETFPRELYNKTGKLPFGCHAFLRYDWTFWKEFINFNNENNENMGETKKGFTCCILNYNDTDNAKRWYNLLKDHFQTYIIDTGAKVKNDTERYSEFGEDDHILLYDNIYNGGQRIVAYDLVTKNNSRWLMTVDADIEINDQNFGSLLNSMYGIENSNDIGVYECSADATSKLMGATVIIPDNIHLYNHGTGGMRTVEGAEGWFRITRIDILDKIYPHLNLEDNKYGWGTGEAVYYTAKQMGLRTVIDDRVVLHHPATITYDNRPAVEERVKFMNRFQELGIVTPTYKKADELKTLVCCIGRNENRYIREYVDWYKNLGVTNICLYDNNFDGEDDFNDIIRQDIEDGYVIYNDWRNKKDCQIDAYNDCYARFGGDYDWILFIDCGDEYLELPRCKTINEYLSMPQFVNFDMIHVNLMTVGDNGLVKYDDRPLHVRFPNEIDHNAKIAYDFPENFHISSIVRGGRNDVVFNKVGWAHTPVSDTLRCCNNVGFTVDGKSPFCQMDFTLAYFKHYTTKTAEEYVEKMKRGFPDQIWDGSRIQNLIETRFFRTNVVTQEKIDIFKEAFDLDFSYLLDKKYDGPKSDDVKIYLLCFSKKNFKFIDDKYVTPLQVGAANGTDVCDLKDNTGDNISGINYFFIENTGTYWIWKNVHGAKYKGQMQYRRPLFGVNENMDIDKIFEQFDVITCSPFYHKENNKPTPQQPMCIPANTVEEGYAFSNCIDDLYILEMVIKMNFPEYAEDYDKYIKNSDRLYYSNGFIMRAQDFDNYASFLFACLNLYAQMANIRTPQDLVEHVKYNLEVGKYPRYKPQDINDAVLRWQCSICGFLSERIWTLWVQHHFHHTRICELPYIKMEPDKMYT